LKKNKIKGLIPKRGHDFHKGNCGEVFLVATSPGMTGSGVLAARGALRSGAGLVKLAVPKSLQNFVDIAAPEIITHGLTETFQGVISEKAAKEILNLAKNADVLAIGPGLSSSIVTRSLTSWKKTIIIDADGLNSISEHPSILMKFVKPVIITPHPGELARLTRLSVKEIQENRVKVAQKAAKTWGVICVLKGANTVVATPDKKVYINKNGNPGMATAGMGDVLTGMIASFVAQGASPYDASILGVYLHGLSGDLAVKSEGVHGLIASDVVSQIPKAILKCLKS